MRAAQYDRYGPPDVLHEAEASVPVPGEGEVLVKVHGTSVNALELGLRSGRFRIATGMRFPKGMGMDFAGEVAGVGEKVTTFGVGDRVWGFLGGLPGGRTAAGAEFVLAKAGKISSAPTSIPLLEAGALPMAGATALIALRDHCKVKPGQRVLIRGASGGVGVSAVLLAKAMGAHVTALAGPGNLDFVRQLGADAALDYHTHGPDQLGRFNAIVDLTGSRMLAYRKLLAPHGRMVTTVIDRVFAIIPSAIYGPKRIRTFSAFPKAQLFADLAAAVDRGELRPIIDTVRPLCEMAAAHAALEAGGGRGKQLVRVLR